MSIGTLPASPGIDRDASPHPGLSLAPLNTGCSFRTLGLGVGFSSPRFVVIYLERVYRSTWGPAGKGPLCELGLKDPLYADIQQMLRPSLSP